MVAPALVPPLPPGRAMPGPVQGNDWKKDAESEQDYQGQAAGLASTDNCQFNLILLILIRRAGPCLAQCKAMTAWATRPAERGGA
jgi:hypothetical protein